MEADSNRACVRSECWLAGCMGACSVSMLFSPSELSPPYSKHRLGGPALLWLL